MIQYLEIILLVFILPSAWLTVSYNLLIRDKNRVMAAWSDIDVQLKRRHDLIPKLIEAVKQYSDYESSTLSTLTELRAESLSLSNVMDKSLVEGKLRTQLDNLIAIAEDYPDLKANQSFIDLQYNLSDVEDHIQYARRYYNGAVRNLNIRIESFPDLIIAAFFKFRKADFFDFEENSASY